MRALVRGWHAALLSISLIGLTAPVWAHVESLRGLDPRSASPRLWTFQLLLRRDMAPAQPGEAHA